MLQLQNALAVSTLLLAGGPCLADVTVLVNTDSRSSEAFHVSVSTRHADFHNGYSRVRFQGLIRANERTRVPVDFYFTLIGHGVWVFHPDYLLESAVTESRWQELPELSPRRWSEILEAGTSLPLAGPGATYLRALEHAEVYRDYYLLALDRAGIDPDPAVVPRLAALLAKADAMVSLPEPTTGLARYDREKLLARRASVLPQIERLHALTRSQRLAVAAFRETMIGPKPMIAALMKDPGYAALAAFVGTAFAGQPARRLPQVHAWSNRAAGITFTYRLDEWNRHRRDGDVLDCARGQLTLDGRPTGEIDLEGLVKQTKVDFCRERDGGWRIDSRWAP